MSDLNTLLEEYATLRDTIMGLEETKEQLAKQIKEAMQAGATPETDLYRAVLKVTRRVEYPTERFREVFGDELTLQAAHIDRKKAEALATEGKISSQHLGDIAQIREIHALHLVSKTAKPK